MPEHTFKKHPLSAAERLWLTEAANTEQFDPKVAKVRLRGELPQGFDHKRIDFRLYGSARLTPIGLWHLNPKAPIFMEFDKILRAIRDRIIEKPGIEQITRADIADWTKLPNERIEAALSELAKFGGFFTSSSSLPGNEGIQSIGLYGDDAYDAYLRYETVDDVLEDFYVSRQPPLQDETVFLWPSHLQSTDFNTQLFPRERRPLERKSIKPGTAFVLMAMNKEKHELEDTYVAIKEVCRDFEIVAYRADEIEHPDQITTRILYEIQTCEYLVADLSYERPNVYYEVGYAHAINKRPILFRRAGTPLHFDLSVHNVPEYKNITELKSRLRHRLEAILGRSPKQN